MSIETWKDEYYIKPEDIGPTDRDQIEAALLKCRGCTKDNLAKHNIRLGYAGLIADKRNSEVIFGSDHCGMCYINDLKCYKCQITRHSGIGCDNQYIHPDITEEEYRKLPLSIFSHITYFLDVGPAIHLLEEMFINLDEADMIINNFDPTKTNRKFIKGDKNVD